MLNQNIAVHPKLSSTSVDATIGDHASTIMVATSEFFIGFFSSEIGELLAFGEGLWLAWWLDLQVQFLKVDAINVAFDFNSVSSQGDEASLLLDDIMALCKESISVSVKPFLERRTI